MSPAHLPEGLLNRLRTTHLFAGIALALLAGVLIGRWAEFWRSSTDFGHGWAVPLLAAYLAWECLADRPVIGASTAGQSSSIWRWLCGAGLVLAGVVFASMRLVLEAFPTWPAMLWLFSIAGWGAAFFLISRVYGGAMARHFVFPLLFTATALPWLTWMDVHLVLPLRTAIAALAAEVVHWIGYPAIAHGTVIEVGRGQVGVDEACSGIRSLQTVIMIALFLGALFKLGTGRRVVLLAAGILLALLTNLARTCVLAWQSAAHGTTAVEAWHDPVGYAQMGVALGLLAWLAWRWDNSSGQPPTPAPVRISHPVGFHPLAAALILAAAVVAMEVGTKLWFSRDDTAQDSPAWQVALPVNRSSYQDDIFTPSMQSLLQCDYHKIGHWQNREGSRRAGYILEWSRGDIARQTISLHNPEVCLPVSGQQLVRAREEIMVSGPAGAPLPFRVSEFVGSEGVFYVFYLAWDTSHGRALAAANDDSFSSWLAFRLDEVRAGRSRFKARVVALAIYGTPDFDRAVEDFRREFQELLQHPDENQINHLSLPESDMP